MNDLVFLAGFPRSGSTVLANILAMHPKCYASPSSPLHSIITNMRHNWSDDSFLLSQLDHDAQGVQKRLKNSTRAFMDTWAHNDKYDKMKGESDLFVTIDKNRGWLFDLELLRELNPNFKIIVTLRRLENIYRSIEKHHRKTLMLEFPDHMSHNLVDARASALFSDQGLIGSIMKALQNVGDIPDIINHILFWRYEDFLESPQESINSVFDFINLKHVDIDFDNIDQSTYESDSYYRMKYPHKINSSLVRPKEEEAPVSPRILNEMYTRFSWYYEQYYSTNDSEIETQKGIPNKEFRSVEPYVEPYVEPSSPKSIEQDVVNVADLAQQLEDLIEEEQAKLQSK